MTQTVPRPRGIRTRSVTNSLGCHPGIRSCRGACASVALSDGYHLSESAPRRSWLTRSIRSASTSVPCGSSRTRRPVLAALSLNQSLACRSASTRIRLAAPASCSRTTGPVRGSRVSRTNVQAGRWLPWPGRGSSPTAASSRPVGPVRRPRPGPRLQQRHREGAGTDNDLGRGRGGPAVGQDVKAIGGIVR